ncbi:hypothetical protein [Ignatzschineria sp. F8392]|nr:hypothetical protein [Ignatzschineria sp. F8392]
MMMRIISQLLAATVRIENYVMCYLKSAREIETLMISMITDDVEEMMP